MSNAEIVALIDAVLALPISDSTKNDLRSFRSQVQTGRIADDDRDYIIKLCQRLQQSKDKSGNPSGPPEPDKREPKKDLSSTEHLEPLVEFVVKASIIGLCLFFWGYSIYSLLREHRVMDAIGALIVFPIGIIFGLGRFIGWW